MRSTLSSCTYGKWTNHKIHITTNADIFYFIYSNEALFSAFHCHLPPLGSSEFPRPGSLGFTFFLFIRRWAGITDRFLGRSVWNGFKHSSSSFGTSWVASPGALSLIKSAFWIYLGLIPSFSSSGIVANCAKGFESHLKQTNTSLEWKPKHQI